MFQSTQVFFNIRSGIKVFSENHLYKIDTKVPLISLVVVHLFTRKHYGKNIPSLWFEISLFIFPTVHIKGVHVASYIQHTSLWIAYNCGCFEKQEKHRWILIECLFRCFHANGNNFGIESNLCVSIAATNEFIVMNWLAKVRKIERKNTQTINERRTPT